MSNDMEAQWQESWLDGGNQSYLNSQYETFLKNPEELPEQWRDIFESIAGDTKDVSIADVEAYFKKLAYQPRVALSHGTQGHGVDERLAHESVQDLIFSYRLLGHMRADINPIEEVHSTPIPELELEHYGLKTEDCNTEFFCGDLSGPKERTLAKILQDLKTIYCGHVASEYLHISDAAERTWVQENLEREMLNLNPEKARKLRMLDMVTAADGIEKYLGSKYPGAKRFSLEGCDTLIVSLDEVITQGGGNGIQEIVIAMAHRGRLNVLVNLLGKMPGELFDLFEEKHTPQEESGDVKYHQGFAQDIKTPGGNIHLSLAFNPSHLEIVTPVATGSVRARQERRPGNGVEQVLCVALHGDASFAGQGVVMESLNMSATRGFTIGGTIHIIINNQIGFTTSNPHDARSTPYCSDIGKMLCAPVFHVNSDNPEAVALVSRIALQYKIKFKKDVIIDLVGYRRWGHNEADEPSATQPLMYQTIKSHPTVRQLYTEQLIQDGTITAQDAQQKVDTYRDTLDKSDQAVVKRLADSDWKSEFASDWSVYNTRDWRFPTSTQIPIETLKQLAHTRDAAPDGFTMDPRVAKIIATRRKMTEGEVPADWGYGETLAYATLLNDGYGVRLSGQDCGRGTFFHRHAEWHDHQNGDVYTSMQHLNEKQGKFKVVNSLLSEAGVLGFEYGYSTSEPRTITIWEAQFGDFANSAQVVIDQFISSGEQKWGRLSGLVLLLPHGYEGQGPEHSSARIERYLQLCAEHNMQVCVPSNPAQMYHMLRRQMLRPMRKPLIAITPKSLLRHKSAVSSIDDFANGAFQPIIKDELQNFESIDRVILCSGKVFYDLAAARTEAKKNNVAIIRMEQLYPFPETEMTQELKKYTNAKKIIWCQEEPMNQGAWYSMQHHVRRSLLPDHELHYIGRESSAAPAVGYHKLHIQQQQNLVREALGISESKDDS